MQLKSRQVNLPLGHVYRSLGTTVPQQHLREIRMEIQNDEEMERC